MAYYTYIEFSFFFLSLPPSPCQISINKVAVVLKFFIWRKGTFNILSQSRKVCNHRDSWGVRSIEGAQGRWEGASLSANSSWVLALPSPKTFSWNQCTMGFFPADWSRCLWAAENLPVAPVAEVPFMTQETGDSWGAGQLPCFLPQPAQFTVL